MDGYGEAGAGRTMHIAARVALKLAPVLRLTSMTMFATAAALLIGLGASLCAADGTDFDATPAKVRSDRSLPHVKAVCKGRW